jgi:hypothetical protein
MKQKLPPREDFEAYERVRRGGEFNMITEWPAAAKAASLSREEYLAVIKNYCALTELYPGRRGA